MKYEFLTYALVDPITNLPFYIGAGKLNRPSQHFVEARRLNVHNYRIHKIRKLINLGYQQESIISILFLGIREECFNFEKELIAYYGRINNGTGILTNQTNGGDGGTPGIVVSEKFRKTRSLQMTGENNIMYGKKHTDMSKQKIKDKHKTIDFNKGNNPNAKVWKIIDPNGNVFIIKGTLQEFCDINGFSSWTLAECAKKKYTEIKSGKAKGWSVSYG